MTRYLPLLLILIVVITIILLNRAFDFTAMFSNADQLTIEITARSTDSYVDATQPIKDGINQLINAGGGVLFFGPGKYFVQETINLPSNITIEGVGAGQVGPTMIILGNNGDMNASGMALFSIVPGAENVAFKDVELRSMTVGPNVYPRYDFDRIRDEQTIGVQIAGDSATQTRNITFQNLRIVNFTYGIDAGSPDDTNPSIRNVKIKNLASEVNYWGMRVRSLNATNWDIQNLNLVEMAQDQNGVKLERTGKIAFLQLSCASTLHNASLCVDIDKHSSSIYFRQAHVEGPSQGFRIRSASTQPIYFENSAIGGEVEDKNIIYSFANRFSSTDLLQRINFVGNGTSSTLYACRDVFTNGYPNPSETGPINPYPGIATVPTGCNFDVTKITNSFSNDALPFLSFDWIDSGNSPSAQVLNVKNFGAIGDGATDDTTAFRAAIQDINPSYWSASTIVVPPGTYKISDTLVLDDGIIFQGNGNATIEFTAINRPLFQVRAMQEDTINKRGIGIKDLSILSVNTSALSQNTTAIELSGTRGAAGDFIFSDLDISGFTRGIYVRNDSGVFDEQQPQFDSIAVRNITLTNNGTGIELRDQNASNWNLQNIQISEIGTGQRGVAIDGGSGSINQIDCVGSSGADACISIARASGIQIEQLTTRNMKYAFYGAWPIGWTPFPVVIKNSDLRDGFYVAGKMYLLSVSNIYADGGQGDIPGSRSTFFNVYGSDDPLNVYPGNESRITSCGDVFRNTAGEESPTLLFVGLTNPAQTCVNTSTGEVDPSTIVATPTINPNGGSFTSSQSVTITTATAGAAIRYTTDGSTPSATAGTLYSSTFNISTTSTIKAIGYKSGLNDSQVSSALFTINRSSGGGSSGGSGTSTATTPSPTTPSPTTPPLTNVNLPANVAAGQVIKFYDSPTVYLVQSTGLHPFDSWSSLLAYQAQGATQISTLAGTASNYTVSSILAKIILGQAQTNPPSVNLVEKTNFICSGSKTIYFYYRGMKEAYSEPVIYKVWNGYDYSKVVPVSSTICNSIPDNGLVRLPQGTFVGVPGGKELYKISGTTARAFVNYSAYQRESVGKTLHIISLPYLHTYSRGENIY